jgi:hypothetical protein
VKLKYQYTTDNILVVDHKVLKMFNLFWLGFIIYTAAYMQFAIVQTNLSWNKIQLLGLLLIGIGTVGLIRFRIEDAYLRGIYILYCGWLLYTVSRGFQLDRVFLFDNLFNGWYGLLPYFAPVVLLFPNNIFYLKKLFAVIIILGVVYLAFSLLYRGELLSGDSDNITSLAAVEMFSKTLSIPCGFLVLTYIYHPKNKKLFAFFIVCLTVLLALIRGRRGLTFISASYLFCFFIIYVYANRAKLSTLLFSFILIGFVSFGAFTVYSINKKGAFSLITERMGEDTRSTVEECFYSDMKTEDWIVGRGMVGEYFCPGVDESSQVSYTYYRRLIETDYLNIILKSGLIGLGLLVLILIPAIIKGFFYSRNLLSKAAAIWILLWMIDLYPANVSTFTLNYLLVWISVGICYSKTIRYMPEDEVKEILSFKIKDPWSLW